MTKENRKLDSTCSHAI